MCSLDYVGYSTVRLGFRRPPEQLPEIYRVLSVMECSAYDPSLNCGGARDWLAGSDSRDVGQETGTSAA
jgi:hypothetical protein